MRFRSRGQNGQRFAFTLIELMVVVAIIGILAALLLPVLARAKVSAGRAHCLSNLRQLGLATQMYWDDHQGRCFRYGGALTNGGQLYWFGWIGPGPEGTRTFDRSQGVLFPYLRGKGVETCPALAALSSKLKMKAVGTTYGYGYNFYLSAAPASPDFQIGSLSRPSETAVLADAAQVNTWQAPASASNPMLEEWYYIDNSSNQPNGHFRHSQRGNLVFADMHAGVEKAVPGSFDKRLPEAAVGRYRVELLRP